MTELLKNNSQISTILSAALFFFWVAQTAPKPEVKNIDTPAFSGKLTLLRALSGPFHTLLADRYWLLSSSLNETSYANTQYQDSTPFFEAMNTIATLDPGYMSSLRYGSTYLASIFRQTDQAHELIDTALDYTEKNTDLYLLKISQEIGYHSPPRYDLINQWIAEFEEIEGGVPEWLGGALLYAKQRELRRELQHEDLKWLLENATNEIEKAAIEQKMARLDRQLSNN